MALAGTHRVIMYGGAIRSGKSFPGIGCLFLLCKMYPGSRWIVVRNTLINLKKTTIPPFYKICPTNFISKFNQDTMTVTFTNGSQIVFFGENYQDDKELLRFRGLEFN